jgi:hypothetical protein
MTYDPDRTSFAHTEWLTPDEGVGRITLHAGDVVRMNNWSAFPDSVILGFNKYGEAQLFRPYAYVSGAGTTGPTGLLGAETYVLPVTHIVNHYDVKENEGFRSK